MDFSQVPIMMITLSGPVGSQRLTEVAEEIQEDLEALPGVNRVNVIGGRVREVHVQVDPKRLAFFELSLADVVVAVARENRNVPGGEIAVGGLEYLVRLPAEVRLPSEIEDFVIKVRDGDPVFVRDVAEVVFGFEDETSRSRVDREPSVTLSVEKRTGANLVGVADLVNAELGRWDEMLPEGINTAVVGDISVEIRRMVNELGEQRHLRVAAGYRVPDGVRGIPQRLLCGSGDPALDDGLVPGAGLDRLHAQHDGAVQPHPHARDVGGQRGGDRRELYRHREHGDAGPEAAYEATVEVARPVIASTITTLCAFSPLLIWPGIIGDFMSYLPVTLIIGLSASLVVALIINPTLCAYLMKPPRHGVKKANTEEHAFRRSYRRLLEWSLRPGPDSGTRSWFLRNWALPAGFVLFLGIGMALALVGMFFQTSALLPAVAVFAGLGVLAFAAPGGLLVRLEPDPPSLPLVAVPHRSPLRMDLDDVRHPGWNGRGLYPDREGCGTLPGGRAPADLHRCRDDRRLQPRRVRRGRSAQSRN